MRSLVLIISLLFAFVSTQGQGAMFLRGSQPAPQPEAGILDSYLGAAFAAAPDVLIYSSHSVTDNTVGSQTEGQTGPYTVLVRRDNDDALRSFTYTEVSDGTLTTWVGPANNGFVRILYDQSTNGNHATQGTAASQPKIVNAGSLVVENGKAALDFDGVNDYLTATFAEITQPTTHVIVAKFNILNENKIIIDGNNDNATRQVSLFNRNTGNTDIFAGSLASFATNDTNQNSYFIKFAGGSSEASKNGNNTTGLSAGTNSLQNLTIGANLGKDAFATTTLQGIIIYPSDQSANRAAIETAINTEYSIY